MCYEEAVMEMNIHVGDDDVQVEKSPKKNEKREVTNKRERSHQEVSRRELGLGL